MSIEESIEHSILHDSLEGITEPNLFEIKEDQYGDITVYENISSEDNFDTKFIINQPDEPNETKKCPICDGNFLTDKILACHIIKVHNIKLKQTVKYNCVRCPAKFNQMEHMRAHIRSHTGERPYKCEICDKRFIQNNHLKTHYKIHTGEKPFSCKVCPAKFRQRSNLNAHMLMHSGERPFKCDICGSRFAQIGHLKSHKLIHTKEKPFQCDICLHSFRQIGNLMVHKRMRHNIHYGKKLQTENFNYDSQCSHCSLVFDSTEKYIYHKCNNSIKSDDSTLMYICSDCGQAFSSAEKIKNHMKSHVKPAAICPICLQQFSTIGEYKEHKKQHNVKNESKYICLLCSSNFESEYSLKKHVTDTHNSENESTIITSKDSDIFNVHSDDYKILVVADD